MVKHGFGYCIAPEMSVKRTDKFYLTRLKNNKGELIIRTCWVRYRPQLLEFTAVRASLILMDYTSNNYKHIC
jgi:hypothetical protein